MNFPRSRKNSLNARAGGRNTKKNRRGGTQMSSNGRGSRTRSMRANQYMNHHQSLRGGKRQSDNFDHNWRNTESSSNWSEPHPLSSNHSTSSNSPPPGLGPLPSPTSNVGMQKKYLDYPWANLDAPFCSEIEITEDGFDYNGWAKRSNMRWQQSVERALVG